MIQSRIAPTPSGYLHVGNAYNFLLTAFITHTAGGSLRLRIDDLDAPRIRQEYLKDIFETLAWLGIRIMHGPKNVADHQEKFSQQLHLPRYNHLMEKLAASGNVFACTCSRKDILEQSSNGLYPGTCRFKNIPLNTLNASWRLRVPAQTIIHFEDAFLGKVSIDLHQQARDFVIRRRDGIPSYSIASLSDDVHYGSNTIVRGADLLVSTAVQLYVANILLLKDFEDSRFYHHPILKDHSGAKLSKSGGSQSLKNLRSSGIGKTKLLHDFTEWKSNLGLF